MVKSKREMKSPRRKVMPIGNPIARSRPTTSQLTLPAPNIKVVVRVRPFNEKEQGDHLRNVIKNVDGKMLIFDPEENSQPFFYHGVQQRGRDLLKRANKNMQFLFDKVFGSDGSNEDVFQHSTHDLIESLMDGFNCSVFVYGATGAGKTHTMLGHNRHPGITFLTMNELFKRKEELAAERDFELAVSYLEVYNENVHDLLNPGTPLHLREDGKYGVMAAGLEVKRIEQASELFEMLEKGNKNRTQHPTDANSESSRSHAVFQVYLRMNIKASREIRIAKLSMIDLAGSERGAATGCTGARFTEGANINKSLLALGNCINGLADGRRHIPYRDSKLTRLLKDSLGGNCQTVMIANISPSSLSYEDTYNTLKYAMRAKKIKSNIKKNVVNCEGHVTQYVKRVEELTKELQETKAEKEELKAENEELKAKVEELRADPTNTECIFQPLPVVASTTSISTMNTQKEQQMKALYAEYGQVKTKLHELHSSEQMLDMKRKLKEEINSRLSNFCADTPDREKGHRRVDKVIESLQQQEEDTKKKVDELLPMCTTLQDNIDKLLAEAPELKLCSEQESVKLNLLECNYKMDLLKKMEEVNVNELKVRGQLLDKMAQVLQPCYLLLRGHGHAPEEMVKEYRSLMRSLQGIGHVSWGENVVDCGVTSSVDSTEEDARASKRKHDDGNNLDETFVLTPAKPKNLSAEQYLSKVYVQPSPAKRLAKAISASPHVLKENRQPLRRPIGTMGTAQRFPAGKPQVKMGTGRGICKKSQGTDPTKLRKLGKAFARSATVLQRKKI